MNAQPKTVRDLVLEYLRDKAPQAATAVAAALGKDVTQIHRAIRDLQDAGLVIGEATTGPSRATVYSLIDEDETLGRDPVRTDEATRAIASLPAPRLVPVDNPVAPGPAETPARRKRRASGEVEIDNVITTLRRAKGYKRMLDRISAIIAEGIEDEDDEDA